MEQVGEEQSRVSSALIIDAFSSTPSLPFNHRVQLADVYLRDGTRPRLLLRFGIGLGWASSLSFSWAELDWAFPPNDVAGSCSASGNW